jgi:hypothetical protein
MRADHSSLSSLQRFNSPLDESAVADVSTNPWHAIALATAALGDSLIIRRRGFFG